MRVVPPYRGLTQPLPRRLRWTRRRVPTRRRIPRLYRPEGRTPVRPSARVSLLHLTTTLVFVFLCWSVGAIFQSVYAGRIYPHITIDHVPVGGMTRDEALAALHDTETARVHQPVFVQAGDLTLQVTPAELGARYDIASAVSHAVALAHHGPFFIGGWNEFLTILRGANVPLSGTHDVSALTHFLARLARKVHVAPRGAVVGVRGNDVTVVRQPVSGQRLDVAGATAVLSTVINTHDATAVTLPLQRVDSALGLPQAATVLAQAHALLSSPIYFQWAAGYAQSWQLTRAGMLRLLRFTSHCGGGSCHFDMSIDARKLGDAFTHGGLTTAVDRAPTSASYQLVAASNPANESVTVLADSPGITINVPAAAADVLQQATVPPPRTIILPTVPVTPTFTAAEAEALQFTYNVGSYAHQYSGLDWARIKNMDQASTIVSTTTAHIVPAGGTFSLGRAVGPLVATNGYTVGQNLVGPGDITGANGGVDDLAAAVLAAAYDAGLSIVQRTPYPYLNVFTSPGLDAMVSYSSTVPRGARGAPDLVLRNTTDHPVLIMSSSDGAGGVAVYVFNSANYAPGHQRGAYQSTYTPQVTLNPDGSVDVAENRTIAVSGGRTTQDSLTSHYTSIDP